AGVRRVAPRVVMRVLGISGSLRADSLNTQLLRLAAEELSHDVEFELYDGLAAIPPYDQDAEDAPAHAVVALRDAIARADAVLFASPEYNGSIPGQLKNALDWVSRQALGAPLRGTPVAVLGGSTGRFGGVWAQAELRKVLGIMGARVVPLELGVGKAHERLAAEHDADLRVELGGIVGTLVGTARGGEARAA
ncbi:MAG: NADPH-dependent FMN reductase, partial [Gaiella sp.]